MSDEDRVSTVSSPKTETETETETGGFQDQDSSLENQVCQKVKSIFLFGLSPNFGLSEKTELIVWSEVRTESEVNLNYSDSVQMNLHARDRLIPYRVSAMC